MKLLVFSDTHESLRAMEELRAKAKKEKPDLIICAGDISIFENDIENQMKALGKFKQKVLLIHGNHETSEILMILSKMLDNVIFLHQNLYRLDNYIFFGYGGGGFADKDKKFEKLSKLWEKNIKKNDKVILITHGPPHNTIVDDLGGDHVGNKSYTKFIKKNKIKLSISGHLHENAKKMNEKDGTIYLNPGPFGKIIKI